MGTNSDNIKVEFFRRQNRYLLALPDELTVQAEDGYYAVAAEELLTDDEPVFHLVTSIEDYPYQMEQYVKASISSLVRHVRVLLIYWDSEFGLYSTMGIWVRIEPFLKECPDQEVCHMDGQEVLRYEDFINLPQF